ncbi:tyrosine-type recombinase/integrase [Aneurinibacillus sp. Ricciae_BoGa-3]|uniref:tyrosine-type recombinase/integrase n=1 Tax=Aneurinibacillus sp. Ricciae_BoGa-3 TaxID=3022697 RepID=UPI0023409AB1|nr:tyrosine-type recombinase/integrase [Aneurinibacillus sp. Ricciae_BoGa-3]WCK52442.1 tyrosine-type recombinase/integrase [Aneurinibacillus sp. Ricciae_BoGa-3]
MEYRFPYMAEYEEYLLQLMRAELTISSYMMELTMFFAWLGRLYPSKEVYEIGFMNVTEYIEEEIISGKQMSTINKKITALKAYFHFLWLKGKVGIDPCAKLKRRPNRAEDEAFYLSEDEIDYLLHTIREEANAKNDDAIFDRNMSFITVFLWAGLRIQEAASLLWKDVQWVDEGVIIGVSLGNVRRFILPLEKGEYLKKYKERTGTTPFVFESRQGKRMSPRSIQFVLETLSKKSGIKFHAQKLRNTFAVQRLKEGNSFEEVADMLGIEQLIIPEEVYKELAST